MGAVCGIGSTIAEKAHDKPVRNPNKDRIRVTSPSFSWPNLQRINKEQNQNFEESSGYTLRRNELHSHLSITAKLLPPNIDFILPKKFLKSKLIKDIHHYPVIKVLYRAKRISDTYAGYEIMDPLIDWGNIAVRKQVPSVMPSKLSGSFSIFALLEKEERAIPNTVKLHALNNGTQISLSADISIHSQLPDLVYIPLIKRIGQEQSRLSQPLVTSYTQPCMSSRSQSKGNDDDEHKEGKQSVSSSIDSAYDSRSSLTTNAGSVKQKRSKIQKAGSHQVPPVDEEDETHTPENVIKESTKKPKRKDTPGPKSFTKNKLQLKQAASAVLAVSESKDRFKYTQEAKGNINSEAGTVVPETDHTIQDDEWEVKDKNSKGDKFAVNENLESSLWEKDKTVLPSVQEDEENIDKEVEENVPLNSPRLQYITTRATPAIQENSNVQALNSQKQGVQIDEHDIAANENSGETREENIEGPTEEKEDIIKKKTSDITADPEQDSNMDDINNRMNEDNNGDTYISENVNNIATIVIHKCASNNDVNEIDKCHDNDETKTGMAKEIECSNKDDIPDELTKSKPSCEADITTTEASPEKERKARFSRHDSIEEQTIRKNLTSEDESQLEESVSYNNSNPRRSIPDDQLLQPELDASLRGEPLSRSLPSLHDPPVNDMSDLDVSDQVQHLISYEKRRHLPKGIFRKDTPKATDRGRYER
ncbi:unnamed protein product, partial [Owenia fusiformis]